MKIWYIDLEKKDKFNNITPLCRIGESKDNSVFYRCDRVKALLTNAKVGDVVDESTFAFEKVNIGKNKPFECLFINTISFTPAPAANQNSSSNSYSDSGATDLSRRQTCANVAGQLIRSLQGQLTPDEVLARWSQYFEMIKERL